MLKRYVDCEEQFGGDMYKKDYRLCVDTPEDYELVTNIYNHFKDDFVSAKNIVKYLDENRDVARINQDIVQKTS